MKFALRRVAEVLGVSAVSESPGASAGGDVTITGWSVDSRTLQPGDLYFALRGPNHDGHAYITDVFAKGAVAAVVDRIVDCDVAASGTVLRVEDSLDALQKLAGWARRQWGGSVIAVTGSAGKTTTKDVIAQMLSVGMKTAKNEGNLNNHVGLPLSLLRVDETAQTAVMELGMNHAGEIRSLAQIARPEVGVVTNVGFAHVENFESIEGIAAAKRELVESLAADGTAVLNADDQRVSAFAGVHRGRSILYGQSEAAQVRAEEVQYLADGVRFRVGTTNFESILTGRHSVSNILAGIAVAGIYGISPDQLQETVRSLAPGGMRGQRLVHRGITIYNDCYNSNPDAARAMLEVLRDTPARRRIAVLGEMLELGRWAEPLHRDVGNYAAMCGIDVLVGIRGASCYTVDAVSRAGQSAGAALFFEDPAEAGRALRDIAQPGDAILFKGSRGVQVERALEQFLNGESSTAEEGCK